MQPIVELPIIERIELNLDWIMEVIFLELQVNTAITVIIRFSVRQIGNAKPI